MYPSQQVAQSCHLHNRDEMTSAQNNMQAVLESNEVLEAMANFDERKEAKSPLFKFVRRYMRMIMLIYTFIRATRDGQFELHLSSLDEMCIYFFAHDKQKYARLAPRYLAEMKALKMTDPGIYQEFMDGNFSVHKNEIPFCAVGVDHVEQDHEGDRGSCGHYPECQCPRKVLFDSTRAEKAC